MVVEPRKRGQSLIVVVKVVKADILADFDMSLLLDAGSSLLISGILRLDSISLYSTVGETDAVQGSPFWSVVIHRNNVAVLIYLLRLRSVLLLDKVT